MQPHRLLFHILITFNPTHLIQPHSNFSYSLDAPYASQKCEEQLLCCSFLRTRTMCLLGMAHPLDQTEAFTYPALTCLSGVGVAKKLLGICWLVSSTPSLSVRIRTFIQSVSFQDGQSFHQMHIPVKLGRNSNLCEAGMDGGLLSFQLLAVVLDRSCKLNAPERSSVSHMMVLNRHHGIFQTNGSQRIQDLLGWYICQDIVHLELLGKQASSYRCTMSWQMYQPQMRVGAWCNFPSACKLHDSKSTVWLCDIVQSDRQQNDLSCAFAAAGSRGQPEAWLGDHLKIPHILYDVDNPAASHSRRNVGREAMAYLTFIAEHFDCLPEVSTIAQQKDKATI